MKRTIAGWLVVVALLSLPSGFSWGRNISIDLRRNDAVRSPVRRLLAASPKSAEDGVLRSFNLDTGAADVGEVAVGDVLAFTLFDDVTLELELKEQMQSPLGGDVFLAEVSGYEGIKTAVVLRTADGLTIDVQDFLNNKVYKVISTSNGVRVSEIEPSHEGKCGCDSLEVPASTGVSSGFLSSLESMAISREEIDALKQQYGLPTYGSTESGMVGNVVATSALPQGLLSSSGDDPDTYVDILVAYDSGASAWVEDNGDITNFAIVAVSRMNTAIANTELDKLFRFRLVGIAQVEAATDSLETALKSATYGYSGWETIKAARDEVGADIVSVLIDTGSASGTVGLGWSLNLTSFASFSEAAYNACAIRAVAQTSTMAHECGHNMGCGHSDVQKTQPGPQLYEYSSGYYFTANGTAYSTIMAYGHENPSGASTTDAPYFSSPDYTFEGVAVGDAIHDNNRTILQTYASVAAFRETKVEIEIGGGDVGQDGLVWVTSRKEALAAARAANKKIFLICGRNTCGYTVATRDYSCENEMVKRHLIKDYICWYSDYDTQFNESAQYLVPYLHTGDLPLIAIIDPDEYNAIDNVNEYQSVNQLRMLLGRVAKEVSISSSAEDGLFENEVEISLASKVGANIYYTLDGTMPSEKSLRYTGPFVIADTTTITAVAIVDGFLGLPVEFAYKKKLKVLNGTHVWTAEKIKGKNECRIISVEPELTGDVIDIPSEISNCKVSGLYYKLFHYNKNITSVTIPEGVTDIESFSFFFCQNLASINIPKSVTQIGRSAFVLCALTNINLEGVVKIENSAFSACRQLRDVVFSTKLKSIGDSAFETCSELINITIPDSVTSIGYAAFRDCSMLTSVTIGSGVTRIGNEAFNGCNGVSEIRVKISNIESWCVNGINSQLPDGRRRFFRGEHEIDELIIPDSITRIGDWVFYNCSGLTSVTIPGRVTSIGDYAFYNCGGLTSVTIPDSVTNIGERAFCACSGLTSVTIPGRVTSIGDYAFAHCRDLSSVTICNGVTVIGDSEFYNCSELTHVAISDSVTSIGAWAFDNCKKLTSITIPASVTNIGDYAFNCCGLKSVTLPASVTNIGEKAFGSCNELFSIEVEPDNPNYKSVNGLLLTKNGKTLIQGIGGDAMIPNCVTSIGCNAFANCSGLTSVTIPESVTDIGDRAFENCGGLTNITIPASVTSMGSYVFGLCIGLTTITFEGNAPSCAGSLISPAYMYMCKAIVTHGSTGWGTNIPGSWNGINIVYRECTPGATISVVNAIIPTCTAEGYSGDTVCDECGAVLSIGSYLPALGHNIENIVTKKPTRTEEGVMTYYCTRCGGFIKTEPIAKLTGPIFNIENGVLSSVDLDGAIEVTIPYGVTRIGPNAFRGCTGLTHVTMPNGVTTIGYNAFYGCSSLASVTIPDSVTRIESGVFNGCSESLYDTTTIDGLILVDGWVVGYTDSISPALDLSGVRGICLDGFAGCDAITSITIAGRIKSVDNEAFYCCESLESVVIGDGVTSIGDWAFGECYSLSSITISATVSEIGEGAFAYCESLERIEFRGNEPNVGDEAFEEVADGCVVRILCTATGFETDEDGNWQGMMVEYYDLPNAPSIEGDEGATVDDDGDGGYTIKPSDENKAVVVTIPDGVEPEKVTIEVKADVETVKPNGAAIKVVNGSHDITSYIAESSLVPDSNGIVNLATATLDKEAVFAETTEGDNAESVANVIEAALDNDATESTVKSAKPGLFYSMEASNEIGFPDDAAKTKSGEATMATSATVTIAKPEKPVGNAVFYRIKVSKTNE
ncbi:MAG: leucine-rich repeat protein [Kiritimatiellae bacterium]|nr:leucine-rich repeat protein [Kiritimatiellia bacterium]